MYADYNYVYVDQYVIEV